MHVNSAENKNNPPRAKRRRDTDGKRSRNRGRTLGGQKFALEQKRWIMDRSRDGNDWVRLRNVRVVVGSRDGL